MVQPSTQDTVTGDAEIVSAADTLVPESAATKPEPGVDADAEPSHIGRHIVIERLGAGAMGVVYAAYDPELDRKLAIKLIRPGRKRGEDQQQRMLREAQAMAKLSHPNVISIYDVGTFAGQVYLAMEFVDGPSLGELLARTSADERDWRQTLDLFRQAGEGLAAAHAAGLVHRDFKPDNVLVGHDGRVRVLDFGLARAVSEAGDQVEPEPDEADLDEPESASIDLGAIVGQEQTLAATSRSHTGRHASLLNQEMTRVGALVGTPAYMPPEHLTGARTDARGDQFSFCVALWEGLYGQRPFQGETVAEVFGALLAHTLCEPPSQLRATLPNAVHEALLRGLSADPEARWPDMKGLLGALRPPDATLRRRVFTAISALVLILGAAVWMATRPSEQSLCTGFDTHLAGVWDDEHRQALRDAFVGAGRDYAGRSADVVIEGLDGWTSGWVSMRQDACAATHLRGEQSEALLDLRMSCLDRRLAQLDALVAVLTNADDAVIEQAPTAIAELESLSACADAEWLRRGPLAPTDPEQVQQLEALTRELDALEGLDAAGRFKDAMARADELAASIDALAWSPLSGRFALVRGKLATELDEFDRASTLLARALSLALETNDDRLAAKAAVALLESMRFEHGSYEQLPLWEQLAAAELTKLDDAQLDARLHTAMGHALWEQAKYDDAIARFEQALSLREAALGSDHLLVSMSRVNLASTYVAKGDIDRGREIFLDARARFVAELGPSHPTLAVLDNHLGGIAWRTGDYDSALAYYDSAYEIRVRALGEEHSSTLALLGNIGAVHGMRGDYERARERFERAVISLRRLGNSTRLAMALDNLAAVDVRLKHYEQARELFREAYEVRKAVLEPDHPDLARSLIAMSQLENEAGDPARARELAEQALAMREGVEVQQIYRARARWVLAEALVRLDGELSQIRELVALAREDYHLAGMSGDELQRFEKAAVWLDRGEVEPSNEGASQ